MTYKASVIIEEDEHGHLAYSPELKGCMTQGDTLDEVHSYIKEAVELYMETLSEDEKKALLSNEILTTSVEVRIGQTASDVSS